MLENYQNYRDTIAKYGNTLTKEQEINLFKIIQDKSDYNKKNANKAMETIVFSNQKLVLKYSNQYYNHHKHIDFMDFVQYGNVGLMKAINTFDLSLNNKFSSYATTCIWHEMINCIAASTVVTNWKNFSSGIRDMVLPVARSLDCEVPQNHNDNPNYRQTYKDILVDNDSDGGLSYLITKNEYDYIVNLMDKEEKKLIDYIYKDRLTLEEVGEIYNLTKQGVHVRLKKIFGEIRNILNSKKYY